MKHARALAAQQAADAKEAAEKAAKKAKKQDRKRQKSYRRDKNIQRGENLTPRPYPASVSV